MEAKGSSFGVGDQANMLQFGGLIRDGEYYLSWDQRHTLILNIDYQSASHFDFNIVWRLNSPKPYTLNQGVETVEGPIIEPNNRRLDWTNYLDFKAKKSFAFEFGEIAAQLEVRNTLDSKNLLWRDTEGRIGGQLDDPNAYDVGRRFIFGLVWSN